MVDGIRWHTAFAQEPENSRTCDVRVGVPRTGQVGTVDSALEKAQTRKTWHRLKGANPLPRVIEGVTFTDAVAENDTKTHAD